MTAATRTLANYDYTWRKLGGDPDTSNSYWRNNVADFLARQELRIDPRWFQGKSVLDVGCGGGRWTMGFQQLGCRVTAIDASLAAVEATRRLVPQALVIQANVLSMSKWWMTDQYYDLVFAWGVLHHTGDIQGALQRCVDMVKPDGLLYLYLYGKGTWTPFKHLWVKVIRRLVQPIPLSVRWKVFRLLGKYRAGVAMDVFGSPIAERYNPEWIDAQLASLGLLTRDETISSTEIRRRCCRLVSSAGPWFLPIPLPPYWFEEFRADSHD